jgi:ketosteroid isomerase-like protein
MKKIFFTGILISLALTYASAQIQWTPEQNAVWKTETTVADLVVKGDLQSAWQYLDDSWVAWPVNSPVPVPKANINKWQSFLQSQGNNVIFFDLIPVVIWVNGNFAYVYYHQRVVWQEKDGKKVRSNSRWMDALVKKNDKWIIVGDLGGADPETKQP